MNSVCDLLRIDEVKHFSSAINNDLFLISEKSGKMILMNVSDIETYKLKSNESSIRKIEILEDHFLKHVQFYPFNEIFTTTDKILGLRVWDTHRNEVIYCYEESLLKHAYSNKGTIAAFNENGIKIYDLRIRHNIDFIKIKDVRAIDFSNQLNILTPTEILKYEEKMLKREIIEKCEINSYLNKVLNFEYFDLKYIKNQLFYIKKKNKKYYIYKDNIKKEVFGSKIVVINENPACFHNNKLEIFEHSQNICIEYNKKIKIMDIISSENNIFVFTEDTLNLTI